SFGVNSPLFVVVRWLNLMGLIALLGVVAFVTFVIPRCVAQAKASEQLLALAEAGAARLGASITIFFLLAQGARLVAQHQALLPGVGLGGLGATLASDWGKAWMLQVVGSIVALVAFRALVTSQA